MSLKVGLFALLTNLAMVKFANAQWYASIAVTLLVMNIGRLPHRLLTFSIVAYWLLTNSPALSCADLTALAWINGHWVTQTADSEISEYW